MEVRKIKKYNLTVERCDYMELVFVMLLTIGFLSIPYIITYIIASFKAQNEIESIKNVYIKAVAAREKLLSGQHMTDKDWEDYKNGAYLIAELQEYSSIEDELDRR